MRCNKIMNRFLGLKSNMSLPLSIKFHILFCSRCRAEILNLQNIFKEVQGTVPFEMKRDITDTVMRNIYLLKEGYTKYVSYSKWIFAGIIIFASIFLLSYSNSLSWLKGQFGSSLEIPLNIVLGLIVSAYVLLFIGTHIDELKKFTGSSDNQ